MDIRQLDKTRFLEQSTHKDQLSRPQKKSAKKQDNKAQIEDARLKKACSDFEGVLLNFMFQSMKKTVPGKGIFSGSQQKDMYESMFYQEISTKFARDRGIGIGDALYRQLKGKLDGPQ
jgi:flagellar protein FlgJ